MPEFEDIAAQKSEDDPVRWVENQAVHLTPRVRMPLYQTTVKAAELFRKYERMPEYHNADGTKTGVELRANWRFGGTYSGVSIGTITATTTVDLDVINKVAPTVLNRVGKLVIDADAPSFEINWTVRDKSYTHSLDVKNGSTVITTIAGLTGSVGTNNKTISLTPAQRTAILKAMVSKASLTATYVLTAYSGSSQMGASSQTSGVIVTEEKTSAPIFTDFAYNDFNHI